LLHLAGMGKKRNVPRPGHYRVPGHSVEDGETTTLRKQALVREAARLARRAARKQAAAPKRRRARAAAKVEVVVPPAFERAHDRELAAMSQRRAARRVKPAGRERSERDRGEREPPRYLADAARGVIRRMARVALSPLSLARAVVDRFRDRD